MNIEKIKEIFSDRSFAKSFPGMETAAEVQAALKEKHIELTEEELLAICDFFSKVKSGEIAPEQLRKQNENDKFSEEALETVADGGFFNSLLEFIGNSFYYAVADSSEI